MTPLDAPSIITSLVNTGIIAAVAWRGIRAINRLMSILQDYPPHRHVNGNILFPKGFEPTHVEVLNDGRGDS